MISFRTARRLAGLLSLAALALAVYLGWRGSARPAFLNQSWATLSAIAGAVVFGVAGVRLFLLSDESELRFMHFMLKWRGLKPMAGSRAIGFLLIVAAACLHFVVVLESQRVYVADEWDYVRVVGEIENLPNGVFGLPLSLVRGEFDEDNRHPLFPAWLATFGYGIPHGLRPFHLDQIAFSTMFGVLVIGATGIIAWRMFGPSVAALAAFLVAVNGAMIEASPLIACETMLALFTTLGWFAFARWNEGRDDRLLAARSPKKASPLVGEAASPPKADEAVGGQPSVAKTPTPHPPLRGDLPHKGGSEEGNPRSSWRFVVVGLLFGLAYLTKASALFPLFILIVLTALDRSTKPRWLAPTLILIGFLVVSWPLLTRNIVRYGNPLHSFNNKLLFAESYEAGIAEPDLGTFGNMKRYMGRHSVKEVVVDRFVGGVVWEGFVLLRSLGPGRWDSGRAIFGFVIFLAAIVGMGTTLGSRLQPRFLLLWTGLFLVFFGWYQPIASGDRFLLPLVPPLTIAASLGILGLLNRTRAARPKKSQRDAAAGG